MSFIIIILNLWILKIFDVFQFIARFLFGWFCIFDAPSGWHLSPFDMSPVRFGSFLNF